MNMKIKKCFSSFETFIKFFFTVAVIILFIFGVLGQILSKDERDVLPTNCREYNPDWQQLLDDGSTRPVEAPTVIDAEYGEVVTLITTLPDNITDGEYICFRPVWQDVTVYVDGELRVDYNTKDSRPFGTNSPMKYVFIDVNSEDSGKIMSYQFSSYSKYAGDIREGYIGDRLSIWLHLLDDNGIHTLIAIFLLMMSLFCIIVCFILKVVYKKFLPLNYLAWTLFFCAFWMLSEISFRQIIFKNISVLSYFTYWSLMIIPLPLLTFMNEIQGERYKKIFYFPLAYSVGILIVSTILQIFDIVQFVEQIKFIHMGLLLSIVCVIGTITVDTFKKRLKDYLFVGIGIYGMILTAIGEMILYYVGTNLSLGTVLSIGLLFLLVMAIIKTGQDLLMSEKKKQQAISAKEAQARFLANMSHEIRTPINAIIGMNEMIIRENDNPSVENYALNIKNASNMLLGLINDILDFSKIESGQLELVEDTYNLATLINDETLILETRSGDKPITTKVEMDPNLPTALYGDELRIKQILANLISNATKYTNEGSITFKIFFEKADDETINLSFSIKDTGIGIKEEDLSQLFGSFKRLELNKNRTIQGSGLGLNITKQLIDLMGGTIVVDSEYQKGSTFTVTIPQKVIDATPIQAQADTKKEKKEGKKTTSENLYTAPDASILVVDDNSMNLTLMKALLKRSKMQVDLVESGKECLKLTKSKTYDIIFMDHMMPEMDGIETLQLIRNDESNPNKNAIIIALTANAVAGCKEMYLEHGFNDYFSKPVIASKLDELILRYLPKELVCMTEEDQNPLLEIDKAAGLSYCMNSENFYKEILTDFCTQAKKDLSSLEKHYSFKNWKDYAIVAHSIKSTSRTIGAENFSKLSLKHELAGKEGNEEFIIREHETYVITLNSLIKKIKKISNP